jgi:predicted amidohydrolase
VLLRQAYAACLQAIVRAVADLIRVACVQLESGADKGENVAKTDVLVERAAEAGARIVVLPEKWNGVGNAAALRDLAEPLDGGKTVATMADWALRHDLWIVGARLRSSGRGASGSRTPAASSLPGASLPPSTARSTCSTSRSAAASTASRTRRSRAASGCSSRPTAGASG